MEICSFVLRVGELLWTPAKRNVGYLVHYKRHIQSLEKLIEKLETTQNDYQQSVDAALMNGDKVKSEVQKWLKDVDKAINDAKRLNNEAGEDKTCLGGCCPNLKWRYGLSKRAVKEAEEMNKLNEEKRFETVSLQVHLPVEFETMSTGDFEAFEATRQAMDQVMKALKDDNVTVIAVHGMGGIGKTTMVKHVGVQVGKGKLFDHVIMAVVSQNPNLVKIQQQLAEMLDLNLNQQTEIARAARLKERIMRGKKILIILDDIWKTIDLSLIGIPDHYELQNCKAKVLLTTRIRNVCHAMKSQEKIHLNILSEEDSWALFVKKANRSFESTNFYDIARKVAGECGGLPIALIAVARALGDKDLEEWREAARRLEMSQTTNLDDEGDVFRCIKLSYDYLNGNDAKSFFLFCCLFPEDSDIQIEDLLKYGIGKGLFRDANSMQEARSTAHSVAKYLKACSLVLDGEEDGCVRMHDVIRDMAILIASSGDGHGFFVKAGCDLKDWPKNSLEDYSAISLMGNEICNLPDELVCPKLQILLLQSNFEVEEIPEDFFQSPNALRVFDISSTQISSLPSSFNLLTKLQALHLDNCQTITDVSILGELKKLEVLSMRESVIEELPEEFGHLTNLRMLDLTLSAYIATIPSNVISRLSKLEELYMQQSFADWGKKVEGEDDKTNASFDELISLCYLNILKVDISDAECLPKNVGFLRNWANFDICISRNQFHRSINVQLSKNTITPHSTSRALLLDTTINTLPDWFNITVTERAEKIIYMEPRSLTNILVEYDHWKSHGLKFLHIQACSEMVTLMNTVTRVPNKPVLESLEELRLFLWDCLQQLCVGELPQGSLGNLKILGVEQCDGVTDALVPSNLLRRLQNLEVLIVGGADMVYTFRSQGLEQGETVLTKLREMKLENLPELTNIWNGPAQPAMFHNLKTLIISKCKKLKTLFTFDIAQCLLQLEELGWRNAIAWTNFSA
nr:disease resistance protein At4g27190-like [Malus domestica]XP_017186275.2 disease resistance protein At4g27190-like [Malus domestica]XP_017186279.2 disease resistance protein At4g27190-like [Malus domestica]XP_028943690.1 disease resistance protein At4g27190-like [Malus domestica]XP_028943691.1 disease resistance protein At4g27190-like [Malus domestica]XP_028943692.1 disease resistance protein At4g27190-like [Malus domestica]XP_028943693.1 disease resistance protein At4g27190-like [Malus d